MYDPKSLKAEEFINHEEIERHFNLRGREQRQHAARSARFWIRPVCRKGLAATAKHPCCSPAKTRRCWTKSMSWHARSSTSFYGNRIVMFAPLYLSNYCVNGCVYCPYHRQNHHIPRKKLTQEEVAPEVIALQDMGHKRLAIEAGRGPGQQPHRVHSRLHQDHLQHSSIKTAPSAA